jgi:hypothetical protein
VPDEAEIQALRANAEGARKKPSRGLWIVSLLASSICVAALVYGLVAYRDAEPTPVQDAPVEVQRSVGGGGFALGLLIGIGAGIAIGSLLAVRRRQS